MKLNILVDESRLALNHPRTEVIFLDTYINLPSLFAQPFCETVAFFNPYETSGVSASRYYHLMDEENCFTLSLSAAGKGRAISGIYSSRSCKFPPTILSISNNFKDYNSIIDCVGFSLVTSDDKVIFASRFNCVECHEDKVCVGFFFSAPSPISFYCQSNVDVLNLHLKKHYESISLGIRESPCSLIDLGVVEFGGRLSIEMNGPNRCQLFCPNTSFSAMLDFDRIDFW